MCVHSITEDPYHYTMRSTHTRFVTDIEKPCGGGTLTLSLGLFFSTFFLSLSLSLSVIFSAVSDLVIATNDREDPSLDDTELPVPISQSDTASNSAISSLLFPPPPSPLPLSISQSSLRRKSKRARTAYTQAQQDALELAFHANPYPDGFFRQKVARQVGIPEDRIQVPN